MKARQYINMVGMAAAVLLSSCVKDTLYDTPHPDYGKIAVTADWSARGEGIDIPTTWTVTMGDYTGTETSATHAPNHLFAPGSYTLAVWNPAEGIMVNGTTATIAAATGNRAGTDAFVNNAPGWFFTYTKQVSIEKDKDYPLTAAMKQQVRELTLIIKPTGDAAGRLTEIVAHLTGAARTLDFATDTYGAASNVVLPFTKITEGDILKNGKFEAEGKVIYIEDTKTHTFRAYYPYNAAGGILTATTDATAQQNQPAIDFLFASGATGDKNNPVVSFTDKTAKGGEDNSFHHRMSQITLTFEAGDGVNFSVVKPERYTLDGLLLTGTFNTADGIATADNGAQTGELAMNLADGVLTSSIILFPQTVASLPLVVNYKGQEYHATLTMPEGALQAGNNYTYTVKVRNKVLEVSEATIAKWNDIDGGEVNAGL